MAEWNNFKSSLRRIFSKSKVKTGKTIQITQLNQKLRTLENLRSEQVIELGKGVYKTWKAKSVSIEHLKSTCEEIEKLEKEMLRIEKAKESIIDKSEKEMEKIDKKEKEKELENRERERRSASINGLKKRLQNWNTEITSIEEKLRIMEEKAGEELEQEIEEVYEIRDAVEEKIGQLGKNGGQKEEELKYDIENSLEDLREMVEQIKTVLRELYEEPERK